ncbi:type IV pilin-like G/H family protein [Calothrix sp. 336/3]|uniref:type IV pilin-like G/H family protein n=1 Tax=Calothrix sp. 336/3 TaxID=1337936 RepID=UPI00069BA94A|nr:type IV pilin-like G/H family protein [Calothrix sp. 336/3]
MKIFFLTEETFVNSIGFSGIGAIARQGFVFALIGGILTINGCSQSTSESGKTSETVSNSSTTSPVLGAAIATLDVVTRVSLADNVNKAKESEGKTYIGSINRGQQAYYLEYSKFAANLPELQMGIQPETKNYSYRVVLSAANPKQVMAIAQAKSANTESFIGLVYFVPENAKGSEPVTVAQVCRMTVPLTQEPAMPAAPASASEKIQCPEGSFPL